MGREIDGGVRRWLNCNGESGCILNTERRVVRELGLVAGMPEYTLTSIPLHSGVRMEGLLKRMDGQDEENERRWGDEKTNNLREKKKVKEGGNGGLRRPPRNLMESELADAPFWTFLYHPHHLVFLLFHHLLLFLHPHLPPPAPSPPSPLSSSGFCGNSSHLLLSHSHCGVRDRSKLYNTIQHNTITRGAKKTNWFLD